MRSPCRAQCSSTMRCRSLKRSTSLYAGSSHALPRTYARSGTHTRSYSSYGSRLASPAASAASIARPARIGHHLDVAERTAVLEESAHRVGQEAVGRKVAVCLLELRPDRETLRHSAEVRRRPAPGAGVPAAPPLLLTWHVVRLRGPIRELGRLDGAEILSRVLADAVADLQIGRRIIETAWQLQIPCFLTRHAAIAPQRLRMYLSRLVSSAC